MQAEYLTSVQDVHLEQDGVHYTVFTEEPEKKHIIVKTADLTLAVQKLWNWRKK